MTAIVLNIDSKGNITLQNAGGGYAGELDNKTILENFGFSKQLVLADEEGVKWLAKKGKRLLKKR